MVTVTAMEALRVQPGETLLLITAQPLTYEQAAAIKQSFATELPDVHIVIASGLTVGAVYRESS